MRLDIQQVNSICNYLYLYGGDHFEIIPCLLMCSSPSFADKPASTPFTSES